jgi:hypothetical protein
MPVEPNKMPPHDDDDLPEHHRHAMDHVEETHAAQATGELPMPPATMVPPPLPPPPVPAPPPPPTTPGGILFSQNSGTFGVNQPQFGNNIGGGSFGGTGSSFGSQYPQQNNQQPSQITNESFGELSEDMKKEDWVKSYWRPIMGWLYALMCFMDFIMFPLITMFLPVIEKGFGVQVGYTPWQSLTLSNGGAIHLCFGAVLGITSYGRTQEKLNK